MSRALLTVSPLLLAAAWLGYVGLRERATGDPVFAAVALLFSATMVLLAAAVFAGRRREARRAGAAGVGSSTLPVRGLRIRYRIGGTQVDVDGHDESAADHVRGFLEQSALSFSEEWPLGDDGPRRFRVGPLQATTAAALDAIEGALPELGSPEPAAPEPAAPEPAAPEPAAPEPAVPEPAEDS